MHIPRLLFRPPKLLHFRFTELELSLSHSAIILCMALFSYLYQIVNINHVFLYRTYANGPKKGLDDNIISCATLLELIAGRY